VLEKGDRPGGSMLLSSGFVWRHESFDAFRSECPDGDPELQRVIFDRLDGGLDWLDTLGAPSSPARPATRARAAPGSTPKDSRAPRSRGAARSSSRSRWVSCRRDVPVVLATAASRATPTWSALTSPRRPTT
jgi:hypothetical protein